jgi:hypothetical protein
LFVLAQIKVFVCLLINLHRLYAHVHSLEIQQAQLAWLLTVTSWNIFFFFHHRMCAGHRQNRSRRRRGSGIEFSGTIIYFGEVGRKLSPAGCLLRYGLRRGLILWREHILLFQMAHFAISLPSPAVPLWAELYKTTFSTISDYSLSISPFLFL